MAAIRSDQDLREDEDLGKVADSIRRGLEQAIAYAKGEADLRAYRVHVPKRIDMRPIRTRLGRTHEEFAGRFGFSVNTPRHWEATSGPSAGRG